MQGEHLQTPASPSPTERVLLRVRRLVVTFDASKSWWRPRPASARRVVDDVSFDVARGETLALVGESGSGKTTIGRALLRLIEPAGGSIEFDGVDVASAPPGRLRALKARMQMIFQDPGGAMNPHHRVETIVAEPLDVHGRIHSRDERRAIVAALLERCGLPAASMDRFPHQFSGGQRQRIAVARAICLRPDFIVCDEPTSALDISVRAQIINLLKDLQSEFSLSFLLISHDLATVQHMADHVAVLKRGTIVETGPSALVLQEPRHDYTKQLLQAVPSVPAVG